MPSVRAEAEHGVIVTLDRSALGAAAAPLREKLAAVLERLPIKTRIHSDRDIT
jgi:hypothetical protein